MHYHVILTENCNLRCKYCYEKSMNEFDNGLEEKFCWDFSEPENSKVDIEKLKDFISKDKDAVIIFYGGEPLLQLDKIKEIMNEIDVPYRMQTNGVLLHLLDKKYLNRIGKILISIDGDKARTDENRGKGTYERVTKNLKLIRENGYTGELIARMTVSQDSPDLKNQVLHLIDLEFDSIHWQLDVGFYKEDFNRDKMKDFFEKYNNSLKELLNWWVSKIELGKVYMIYPFVGIAESLLRCEKTKIRCGAGHSGYAITTSGKVVACPIMNSVEDFKAGDLNSCPVNLKKFEIKECENCDYLDLCGGRCMYWRRAGLWPKVGDEMICDSIKFYIDSIKEIMPRINATIDKSIIKKSDFEYEKYFGPEIIP